MVTQNDIVKACLVLKSQSLFYLAEIGNVFIYNVYLFFLSQNG